MINQQIIDVVNSCEAWAFVGSGCSIEAGLPSWGDLLNQSASMADAAIGNIPPELTKQIYSHLAKGKVPEAFTCLKRHYGSKEIDAIVCKILSSAVAPGEVTKTVAHWPFASYLTTNYDHLLEQVLQRFAGWVAVGNTADENAKISGDVRSVIWHPHGGIFLGEKNTRLVLASSDYDEIYPSGSPTLAALETVCRMKRIIFIGFGFRDLDLVTMLRRIARQITPDRPVYGFLANCNEEDCAQYWKDYKIEIIPYTAKGRDHSDLLRVLKLYGTFILDRTMRFDRATPGSPDYDFDTVGLLTHNRLCRSGWNPEPNTFDCIAEGLVLAKLKICTSLTVEQLIDALPNKSARIAVERVVKKLVANGDISKTNDQLTLSTQGDAYARQGKADYELARDQFRQSVRARATEKCSHKDLIANVCDVATRYLERTCRERGLGVAQQLVETGDIESRSRTVALLQGSKIELESAITRDAAMAAVECIWDVLSAPRPEEKRYLGCLTQANFGRHLLGVDPASTSIQHTNFSSTIFIADSNFIIPLLAIGSVGHLSASTLFKKLVSLKCKIFTSDYLLEECVEHAKWAWNLLNAHGSTDQTIIDASRGKDGYRINAFLSGYLNHPEYGPEASFKRFYSEVFDSGGEIPDEIMVSDCLTKKGFIVNKLDEWQGFTNELFRERDLIQGEIRSRRERNHTFKHDRQVKAEAEVALIVTQVRRHTLSLADYAADEAFFLSYSRVVDNLPRQAHRICITPESLFEWILSIGELKAGEADAIFDQLLWILNKAELDVVPRSQLLRLFHNTINASRVRLEGLISEHHEIVREQFAVDPEKAFLDSDPLSIPGLIEEINSKVLIRLKHRLAEERRLRDEAESKAKLSVRDLKEYERLKLRAKEKRAVAGRRKRAAQSRPHKKKTKNS